ncbi:hypothetical protein [Variovorax boronicumulans]|uniref:hypothetical protein n=1 Tax=Variovorax boronicumulans TaxID=436515 RepID=UPI003399BE86
MSKFDQYLSTKPPAKLGDISAHTGHTDSRVAMYKAFAEDERAKDARTESTPLVQWARKGASLKQRLVASKTPSSTSLASITRK